MAYSDGFAVAPLNAAIQQRASCARRGFFSAWTAETRSAPGGAPGAGAACSARTRPTPSAGIGRGAPPSPAAEALRARFAFRLDDGGAPRPLRASPAARGLSPPQRRGGGLGRLPFSARARGLQQRVRYRLRLLVRPRRRLPPWGVARVGAGDRAPERRPTLWARVVVVGEAFFPAVAVHGDEAVPIPAWPSKAPVGHGPSRGRSPAMRPGQSVAGGPPECWCGRA